MFKYFWSNDSELTGADEFSAGDAGRKEPKDELGKFAKAILFLITAIVIAFAAVVGWLDEKRTWEENARRPPSDMPFTIP